MPKPTLLQNIFNQPTQSYLGVQRDKSKGKERSRREFYHSVRNDMVRAAEARLTASGHAPLPATPLSLPSFNSPSAASASREAHPSENRDSDDNDEDDFFTPSASPRESAVVDQPSAVKTQAMGAPQPALLSPMDSDVNCSTKQNGIASVTDPADDNNNDTSNAVLHLEQQSNDGLKTVSIPEPIHPEAASSMVSLSATSELDGTSSVSEASWPTSFSAPSTSTRATTPATSESGHTGSASRNSSARSNSLRRKKAENRRSMTTTYTDDDWAKDVRWLVSPTETNSEKRKSWSAVSKLSIPPTTTTATVPKRRSARPRFDLDPASMSPTLSNVPLQILAPHGRAASQSTANSRRSMGRRRMSAVWEEDEGDEAGAPTSPRRVHTDPAPLSSLARSRSSLSQQRPPLERVRSPTSVLSGETGSIGSSPASTAFTSASRTVDVPIPLPVTDGGTPSGFTSLVLPRAAYTPASNKRYSLLFGNSSHVDITRSGLAQTTMSTVSITKNAASSALGHGARPRILSLSSLSVLTVGSDTAKTKLPKTPSHLLNTLPRPLSFASHTPPPSKVNSHQILVQVYAVALDGLDDRIVSEKVARKDCYGFVPGRSFVGRAVEIGFEVNNVSKSDWVIGLLDVRKCGALAEFVIVEKRRVTRCPRPSPSLTLEQLALLPLCGVSAHRAVRTIGIDADTERDSFSWRALVLQGHDGAGALAVQALSHAGMHVTAHIPLHADSLRMRTASTSSAASSSEPCDEKDSEFGIESASTREAEERVRKWGARGVRIGDAVDVVENCDAGAFDLVIDTVGGKRIWDACQRILAAGGQFTTLIGDVSSSPSHSPPASAHPLSSPSPSHFSFYNHHSKSHSDEIGGRAVPSINAHFRANLRSIRRAFKARKSIGYTLVSPAADVDQCGEDVRDSLVEAVRRAASGIFVPFVGEHDSDTTNSLLLEKEKEAGIEMDLMGLGERKRRIVPFERAPELFGSGVLSEGRTGVVRIVD